MSAGPRTQIRQWVVTLFSFSAEESDLSLTSVISFHYSTTEDRLTLTVEGTL